MPIPNPKQSENREEYIGRCMTEISGEYDAEGQAIAVCIATYEKDNLSKIRSTSEKVMARIVYDTKFKGINLKEPGDPCWDGYEMIGMKDDGTPNCVPIKLEAVDCPPATKNVGLNLYNRQTAINQAKYGPLNPNEPNEEYWKAKADEFGGNVEEAKTALCGNCAFFDIRKNTIDCIKEGIGYDNDPELVVQAGELGYCDAFDFKCAAKRTCSAWVVGGPIND